jgi:hypothetical protein
LKAEAFLVVAPTQTRRQLPTRARSTEESRMNGTLPKTRVPTASTPKPKQPLNSKCNKGTITAKMIADNVDVTRARGTKGITT